MAEKGGIYGFQKMTLLDFPEKVACTVFFGGCNLRCPFCHNASLVVRPEATGRMDTEEVLAMISARKHLLDGVAVSGGEPLLYESTADFLRSIKEMGLAVKLDTNGTFPDRLKRVVQAGLVDYVAMDIKNSPESYARTVGLESLDLAPLRESVAFLMSDAVEYEFRTTVVAELHSPEDMEAIGQWLRGAKRYYLQSFVDSGDLIGTGMHGVDKESMLALRDIAKKYITRVEIRGI